MINGIKVDCIIIDEYSETKMSTLKFGDRVRALGKVDGKDLGGMKGTVIVEGPGVGIQFDDDISGHHCGGKGKIGHCRYSYKPESELEIINDKKTIMEKLTIIGKKLFDPKIKKMIEAGLLNRDLEPTSEGLRQSQAIEFMKNMDSGDLEKVADEIIAERKEENSK